MNIRLRLAPDLQSANLGTSSVGTGYSLRLAPDLQSANLDTELGPWRQGLFFVFDRKKLDRSG